MSGFSCAKDVVQSFKWPSKYAIGICLDDNLNEAVYWLQLLAAGGNVALPDS